MRFSALLLASSAVGVAVAAPASGPIGEAVRSVARVKAYTGYQIVAKLAALQQGTTPGNATSLQARAPADPNACYADCILGGGSDWECICRCVACGGRTPPPP